MPSRNNMDPRGPSRFRNIAGTSDQGIRAHFMLRLCCLHPWNNTHSEPSGQIQRDIIISEPMVVDEMFSRVEARFR